MVHGFRRDGKVEKEMIGQLLLAAIGSTCVAQQSHVVQRSYVAPVYQAQASVYYFVGAPLRAEALIKADPDYQEFKAFKQWQQDRKLRQSEEMGPPMGEPAGENAVTTYCASCHGTATPAGDFFLDGKGPIEPYRITKALRKIAAGEMPKNKQLTKEQRNELLKSLLDLEEKPEGEQPPPEPVAPISQGE